MTTVASPSSVQSPLIPIQARGWRGGLGNLVRKEFGQWWRTRLWWVQLLIWVVILNGISTVVMLDSAGMTPDELVAEAVQTFLLVAATSVGIGIVVTIQGSVVGEKEMGTAAWVMSKPVSRAAFVLAKLIAHTVGFWVTALVIPGLIFAVAANYLLPQPISYSGFAIAVAVLALAVVFYVTLTIALGCMFSGRGPVAGVGITLILMGQFFKGMLPLPLVMSTPWLLGDVAGSFALGTPPEWNRMIPVIVTAAATLILVWVAVWRFQREEF
jgi:ABC-2 type transport system permease protein